jgi:hypothetical protein
MLHAIARPLLALCILSCALQAAAAAPDPARIEELMRKSGLWTQLGAMQAQVREGAAAGRANGEAKGAKRLDDAEFAKLLTLAGDAFAPDRLRSATARRLGQELGDEDVTQLLAFATSDLGQRFTRAEEAVADIDQAKLESGAKAALASASDKRKSLLRRIVTSLRADELAADMTTNMTNAIVFGVAASLPDGDGEAAIARAKKQAEAQRPQLVAYFRELTYLQAAYTYREMSDGDLERYLAFNETPVARHFNEATARALDYAIVQCALQLGRSIANEFGNKRRSA